MFDLDLWREIFQSMSKNKTRAVLSGFTVAFAILVHSFEAYLDLRQRTQYKKSQLDDFPEELEETVSRIDEEGKKEDAKKNDRTSDRTPESTEVDM